MLILEIALGLLGSTASPTALQADEDGVIYLGSFSKTFAPGFRVYGWAPWPRTRCGSNSYWPRSRRRCPRRRSPRWGSAYLCEPTTGRAR